MEQESHTKEGSEPDEWLPRLGQGDMEEDPMKQTLSSRWGSAVSGSCLPKYFTCFSQN